MKKQLNRLLHVLTQWHQIRSLHRAAAKVKLKMLAVLVVLIAKITGLRNLLLLGHKIDIGAGKNKKIQVGTR